MIKFAGFWVGEIQIAEKEFQRLRPSAERAIIKAQLHFESAVKVKLQSGKRSGRIYNRPSGRGRNRNRGKPLARSASGQFMARGTYQASAPGEPPQGVSGDLRKSITHGPVVWEGDTASGPVGSSSPYARILEYGGMTGRGHLTRILPRPYMAPTYLEEYDALSEILSESVTS